MTASHERRSGFTLLELLTVIGMIGILASLLLPTLARAKTRARLTQCGNNVRQIGLASSLYVTDHRDFPLFAEYDGAAGPGTFWSDRLQGYTRHSWVAGGVYRCPSYPERNRAGLFTAKSWCPPKGSYDMNGFGLSVLGKFGIGGEITGNMRTNWLPCPESRVAAPSEMIGFGDVIMGLDYSGSGYFGFPHYYPERRAGAPEEVNLRVKKSRAMEARRHLGRFNVVFIDNHLEPSQPEMLFAATDEGMSRWNNDHQPHPEALHHWGE